MRYLYRLGTSFFIANTRLISKFLQRGACVPFIRYNADIFRHRKSLDSGSASWRFTWCPPDV